MRTEPFVVAALLGHIKAQNIGNQKQNMHPELSLATCTASGCNKTSKSITLDANWRWVHNVGGYTNCYTGNSWDKSFCPDPDTCAQKCALDGVDTNDWQNTYGVHSTSDELELGFVTQGQYAKNVGSRTYMMDSTNQYEMFKLKNQEFTFDVDVSNMPCGINGALYFVQMDADGGSSKNPGNKAGAAYGTGYCDAQCPQDVKFINGEANVLDWISNPTDPNSGTGKWGACCSEMDIWEANEVSSAFTAHPCTVDGHHRCESDQECGTTDRYSSVCDPDGCDLNAYRVGVKDFFGSGSNFKVDTSKPFTVVTQFHTSDNSATGDLVEIKRLYVQNNKVIEHPKSAVDKLSKQFDSITDEMCDAVKDVFGDQKDFSKKGGLKKMGEAMDSGMVLVMSIWDDHAANMLWLDSTYPADKTTWGGPRGSCDTKSGVPSDVESKYPNSAVKFSNIKIGDFGTTYNGGPGPTPPSPGCPGGTLQACIGLCPTEASAYKACVSECVTRCSSEDEQFLQ